MKRVARPVHEHNMHVQVKKCSNKPRLRRFSVPEIHPMSLVNTPRSTAPITDNITFFLEVLILNFFAGMGIRAFLTQEKCIGEHDNWVVDELSSFSNSAKLRK